MVQVEVKHQAESAELHSWQSLGKNSCSDMFKNVTDYSNSMASSLIRRANGLPSRSAAENKQLGKTPRLFNYPKEHGAITAAAEPVTTWLPRSQMLASEECVFHKLIPLLTQSDMSKKAGGERKLVRPPIRCMPCWNTDTCRNTHFNQKLIMEITLSF